MISYTQYKIVSAWFLDILEQIYIIILNLFRFFSADGSISLSGDTAIIDNWWYWV